MMNRKTLSALIVAMLLGSSGTARTHAAELNKSNLGPSSNMWAMAVSADGAVIVGYFRDAHHWSDIYRWTQAGGAKDLGIKQAQPSGISADGSVIVGCIDDAHWRKRAFRWTQSGGVQDLGTMGGSSACASGISADGSVVVGSFHDANNVSHAFRWTQTGGAQDLGMRRARATGVSADGSVIAGDFTDAPGVGHAFRWTQAGGVQDLGTMGGTSTSVDGLSADGSVLVGDFRNANGVQHLYRWTQSGGAQDLGSWQWAEAKGVSADGSVIVGDIGDTHSGQRAFRWTQSGGVQELSNVTALTRLIYASSTVPIIVACLILGAIACSIFVVVVRHRRSAAGGEGDRVSEQLADHTLRSRVYLFGSAVLVSLIIFLIRALTLPAVNAATLRAIDACSLLSQEELNSAIGAPMRAGNHDFPGGKNACSWIPTHRFSRRVLMLELWVEPATMFDLEKAGTEDITSAPGLGDDAYYANIGVGSTVLNVKKGPMFVKLEWLGHDLPERPAVMEAERTIVAHALKRMDRSALNALINAVWLRNDGAAKSIPPSGTTAASPKVERSTAHPATTTLAARDRRHMGGRGAWANAASTDGSVIAGDFTDAQGAGHAFRWTRSGGAQDLGTLGGTSAWVNDVSADGSVVVGDFIDSIDVQHAYRWTQSGGVHELGTMGGTYATASAVSADGSVIVGRVDNPNHIGLAFRWTRSGGAQDLGIMGGGQATSTSGVSTHGSVIVGAFADGRDQHAYRWTQSGGVQDLGMMGGTWGAMAWRVSADGSVIVGVFADEDDDGRQLPWHAFRWTQSAGAQELSSMGGTSMWPSAMSADGSMIVGSFHDASNVSHVFRWTRAGGAQDLGTLGGISGGPAPLPPMAR